MGVIIASKPNGFEVSILLYTLHLDIMLSLIEKTACRLVIPILTDGFRYLA
jgi:hypothetical protein